MTSPEPYLRHVQAPPQWIGTTWDGTNVPEIDRLLADHGITATVMQAGTSTLLLLINGSSSTYAPNETVVIASDDGVSWRHEPARRSLVGLVPITTYYVS